MLLLTVLLLAEHEGNDCFAAAVIVFLDCF